LLRRTPAAIRIDGKAFHTFTKHFDRPFDNAFMKSMNMTMLTLCMNIQGCVLGYTQSDEITLILVDYKNLNSQAWFNYEVQKMCSISASIATESFNTYLKMFKESNKLKYIFTVPGAANFDSRCFNIPREEVTNLLYWRQVDAIRNSTEMIGRAFFSNKELMHKKCKDIIDMLGKINVYLNDYEIGARRCRCCIKRKDESWMIDEDIPIFKDEGREYIERLINFNDGNNK
jgi:tRNA(His) guanylyltransferase